MIIRSGLKDDGAPCGEGGETGEGLTRAWERQPGGGGGGDRADHQARKEDQQHGRAEPRTTAPRAWGAPCASDIVARVGVEGCGVLARSYQTDRDASFKPPREGNGNGSTRPLAQAPARDADVPPVGGRRRRNAASCAPRLLKTSSPHHPGAAGGTDTAQWPGTLRSHGRGPARAPSASSALPASAPGRDATARAPVPVRRACRWRWPHPSGWALSLEHPSWQMAHRSEPRLFERVWSGVYTRYVTAE
jgi:hypothetical protein